MEASNPTVSTGPRTAAGKAASSKNALKTGLYSVRDFVRPGEEQHYANTLYDLMSQLSPEGVLEECFATEIMKASWRLHRCRTVEQDLAGLSELDPMIDEKTDKSQKSVDRARAQSHYILRRSIAELNKLQTVRRTAQPQTKPQPPKDPVPSSFCNPAAPVQNIRTSHPAVSNKVPRNATCPCGSGTKYKKCCGNSARPAADRAA